MNQSHTCWIVGLISLASWPTSSTPVFASDTGHNFATLLHFRYHQLKRSTDAEQEQTQWSVRSEMGKNITRWKQQQLQQDITILPEVRKQKFQGDHSFLQHYDEDDFVDKDTDEANSASDDIPFKSPAPDKLWRYLTIGIDKKRLSIHLLGFWSANLDLCSISSTLAKRLHSMAASSAAIERCFSSGEFIVVEQWISRHPDQIDEIQAIHAW